jgi:hypothetical protein
MGSHRGGWLLTIVGRESVEGHSRSSTKHWIAFSYLTSRISTSRATEVGSAFGIAASVGSIFFDDGDDTLSTASECTRVSGRKSERLSAELWYSGHSPLGVRTRQPPGRSKLGELVVPVGNKRRHAMVYFIVG